MNLGCREVDQRYSRLCGEGDGEEERDAETEGRPVWLMVELRL